MIEILHFCVIGAGSGGLATAAHLALNGYGVTLYNRSESRIKHIKEENGIKVCGVLDGFAKIKLITNDIKKALEGANVILVVIPASGHKEVATICCPYLNDGQMIILTPGRTLGALEFLNTIRKNGSKAKVLIAETETILYTCRSYENAIIDIIALKNKVRLAALPATKTNIVIDTLKEAYPQFVPALNILDTGFNNIGSIFHPTPTILNAGWIETPTTEFKYYYDGISPTIASFLELIDSERINVARKYGINAVSAKDWLFEAYGVRGSSLYESLQNNDRYKTIDAPKSLKHRYVYEDIPTGLVPIASFGELSGTPTSCLSMIISLSSKLMERDFLKDGRNLGNLGLKNLKIEDIINLVNYGIHI